MTEEQNEPKRCAPALRCHCTDPLSARAKELLAVIRAKSPAGFGDVQVLDATDKVDPKIHGLGEPVSEVRNFPDHNDGEPGGATLSELRDYKREEAGTDEERCEWRKQNIAALNELLRTGHADLRGAENTRNGKLRIRVQIPGIEHWTSPPRA